jgi:hypothetical protein
MQPARRSPMYGYLFIVRSLFKSAARGFKILAAADDEEAVEILRYRAPVRLPFLRLNLCATYANDANLPAPLYPSSRNSTRNVT